jgi:hypothetical protein
VKRYVPAAIAVAVLAALGITFWLADRSGPIPSAMPSSAPAVGSCWHVAPADIGATLPWPGNAVACTTTHNAEIFYRGQVDHSLLKQYRAAKGQAKQAATLVIDAEARSGCTGRSTAYLGGNWRGAQLTIVPVFIAPQQDGFFACVTAQVTGPGATGVVNRTAPLAGALADGDALAIDCFAGTGSASTFTPCTEDHTGEFVGLYTVTPLGAPFNGPELQGVVTKGCQGLLNGFLGLPSAAANRSDLQSSFVGPGSSAEWLGSDQTYACYASSSVTMRGSIKDLGGTRPLPR